MFRAILLFPGICFVLGLSSAVGTPPVPPLVLVSIDGFRWDYCSLHPDQTPNLRKLMKEGVSAEALIPVFPSNTFPNHYSIVTGLYPAHHGIINNRMYDPRWQEFFYYNRAASVHDPRWWGGEPIWVTAIKQGRKSASYYWVGSETEVGGVRPTYAKSFADFKTTPFPQRVNDLVGWLKLPEGNRPSVIVFYIEQTNTSGHRYGPDSWENALTIRLVDYYIGAIVDRLNAEDIRVNLIVVSDHGMTARDPGHEIILDDYLDMDSVQVEFDGPEAGLRPMKGDVATVLKMLEKLPRQAKAYRAEDLPSRFHLTGNPRIPPIWILADEGWHVQAKSLLTKIQEYAIIGQHGYDPQLKSMQGVLIAHGPSFRSGGAVIDPVENIHVYNLMCAILGLRPAPNDGDDRLVRAMVR